jgi:DNA-binding transcriptional LysR family regulator
MDRWQTLSVFVRVAEMESFTAAAKSLGVPKATASNALQQLEARLGTRLLHRTTRRVHLTQDGAVLYERCKDLLADIEEVETLFQKSAEALTGRIRVDMPSRMARFRVIPQLPKFLDEHPALEIELGSTDRVVDLVREGYDCVVRVGALAESGLVARRLGEVELINCASPGYLRKHGIPRGLADLERHFLVHYVSTLGATPDGWEYQQDGVWKELPMRGLVTVNNAEAYAAAAIAGLGLIQVPRSGGLKEELRERRLVEVLPKLRARPMPVTILYPHRRHLSRRVRVFIEWLATVVGV